jgi:hypothetical protein
LHRVKVHCALGNHALGEAVLVQHGLHGGHHGVPLVHKVHPRAQRLRCGGLEKKNSKRPKVSPQLVGRETQS